MLLLLLLLVVAGIANQPIADSMQHVHDVAERLIHLADGALQPLPDEPPF
jgi:hypothetical protein